MMFILILVLIALCSSASAVHYKQYKYYKAAYLALPNLTFLYNKEHDQVKSSSTNFIWFRKEKQFKLLNEVYLHNYIVTLFDLYTLYWFFKFYIWCNKNIDVNILHKY